MGAGATGGAAGCWRALTCAGVRLRACACIRDYVLLCMLHLWLCTNDCVFGGGGGGGHGVVVMVVVVGGGWLCCACVRASVRLRPCACASGPQPPVDRHARPVAPTFCSTHPGERCLQCCSLSLPLCACRELAILGGRLRARAHTHTRTHTHTHTHTHTQVALPRRKRMPRVGDIGWSFATTEEDFVAHLDSSQTGPAMRERGRERGREGERECVCV